MSKSHVPAAMSADTTWWLRFASSSAYSSPTTLHERELARRSDLIAWIALAFLGGGALLALTVWYDFQALGALLFLGAGIGFAIVLNRRGRVASSGILLIAITSIAIWLYVLSNPLGLTLGQLGTYDVLVITVVLAASVLPRGAAFVVAAINSGCIVLDYLFQPHYRNIAQDALLYSSTLQQTISVLVRPIALNFVLAVIAFLWARGTVRAIQRAEHAEEIVALERREIQRTYALEEGVRYLHQTLAPWAAGDFRRSVPPMPLPILEQVRADLNALNEQCMALANDTLRFRLLQEDARQLTLAIDAWATGQPFRQPTLNVAELARLSDLLGQQLSARPFEPMNTPLASGQQREVRSAQDAYPRFDQWPTQGGSGE